MFLCYSENSLLPVGVVSELRHFGLKSLVFFNGFEKETKFKGTKVDIFDVQRLFMSMHIVTKFVDALKSTKRNLREEFAIIEESFAFNTLMIYV